MNIDDLKDHCIFDSESGKYIIIHGTYKDNWESIKDEGLSRSGRNTIHFASGLPGDKQVISGMRSSANIFIYLDIQKALDIGIEFYISENKVILTEGNDKGFLETKFFWKVLDRETGTEISFQ